MGITSQLDGYPAEVDRRPQLGVTPLEMADAYATIADGGLRNRPTAIDEGRASPTARVDDLGRSKRKQVFTDGEAYEVIAADAGRAVGRHRRRPGIGCPAAGKTGTTSNNTDAWFVGYHAALSTAVWVGYPERDDDARQRRLRRHRRRRRSGTTS